GGGGGGGQGGLETPANSENPPERAAQVVAGSVGNQLWVGINVTATLQSRCLGCAERLGVADQHDGERTRRKLAQYRGVQVWQRQVGQSGREVAGHVHTGRLSSEQSDQDRCNGHDDERRWYGRGQKAKQPAQPRARETGRDLDE